MRIPSLGRMTLRAAAGAVIAIPLYFLFNGIADGVASAIAVQKRTA